MSAKKSWWSYFAPAQAAPQRRFTIEELRELYNVLARNPVVHEGNRAEVVETIRSVAEYMIWGDQNEPRIFDFFLEHNIMVYLYKVLLQPSNRSGEVGKQVLQTLSIIIQNVRSETGIFFLFSNNHVNSIVDLDFDFEDEEVLGYYISFLKTISLKLNKRTVHFFFDDNNGNQQFPLYSRAITLAHHKEGMVRAAVRTLTLNVYSVDDPRIQVFVISGTAASYFYEVAGYLAQQVQVLDLKLQAAEGHSLPGLSSLDSQLAEVEDVVSYCSDVLGIGVPSIAQVLAERLWHACISPLLLQSLLDADSVNLSAAAAAAAGAHSSSLAASGGEQQSPPPQQQQRSPAASSGGAGPSHSRTTSWGPSSMMKVLTAGMAGGGSSGGAASSSPARVRPTTAIFALERLFQLISYAPLLHQLLLALACGDAARSSSSRLSCRADSGASKQHHQHQDGSCQDSLSDAGGLQQRQASSAMARNNSSSSPSSSSPRCRHVLLHYLNGSNLYGAVLVLRLLVALLNNRHISLPLLAALRMAPKQRQPAADPPGTADSSSYNPAEAKELALLIHVCLQQLQGMTTNSSSSSSLVADASEGGPSHRRGRSAGDLDPSLVGSSSSSSSLEHSGSAAPGSRDLMALLMQQYLPRRLQELLLSVKTEEDAAVAAAAAGLGGMDLSRTHAAKPASSTNAAAEGHGSSPQLEAAADAGEKEGEAGQLPSITSALRQLQRASSGGRGASSNDAGAGDVGSPRLPQGVAVLEALLLQRASAAELQPVVESEFVSMGPQVFSALLRVLQQPEMPLQGLCLAGWLLYQLLPPASSLPPPGATPSTCNGPPAAAGGSGSQPQGPAAKAAAAAASAHRLWHGLQQQLQDVVAGQVAAAHSAFQIQLGGMWCDALVPLLTWEWRGAREQLLRPVLRASTEAMLSGPQVHQLLAGSIGAAGSSSSSGGGSRSSGGAISTGGAPALSVSALAAVAGYACVQRLLALEQLQQLLASGSVSAAPNVPSVTEVDLKQVDIQEGFQLDLSPGSALPCMVSFAPGQERRVYFAVAGVSLKGMEALSGSSNTAAAQASLLRSLPVAVLADPHPTRQHSGVVLSVAPLMGADPCPDTRVGKWLHVHVRPSVRGLLRVLRTCGQKKGGFWSAMKQLADGHWVLAFADAEKSTAAQQLVQRHADMLVGLYRQLLQPLAGEAGAGAFAAAEAAEEEEPEEVVVEEEDEQEEEDPAPLTAATATPSSGSADVARAVLPAASEAAAAGAGAGGNQANDSDVVQSREAARHSTSGDEPAADSVGDEDFGTCSTTPGSRRGPSVGGSSEAPIEGTSQPAATEAAVPQPPDAASNTTSPSLLP